MTKLIFALMFLGSSTFAEVAFEGYYKIENDGKPSGFAVRRVEVDKAKKTRTVRYFAHTLNSESKVHEESLVVTSDSTFHPIESDYTSALDGKTEHVHIKAEGKSYDVNGKKIDAGADDIFETSALQILMNTKPMKSRAYGFMSAWEKTGEIKRGQILSVTSKPMGKMQVWRILEFYDELPVESWITSNGEILKEIFPKKKISSTLVKNADAAIGSMAFDRATLKKMFDDVPAGKKNVLANPKTVVPDFPEFYNNHYVFEPFAIMLKPGKK